MVSARAQYESILSKVVTDVMHIQMKLLEISCLAFSLSCTTSKVQSWFSWVSHNETHGLLGVGQDVKFYLLCDRRARGIEVTVDERHQRASVWFGEDSGAESEGVGGCRCSTSDIKKTWW